MPDTTRGTLPLITTTEDEPAATTTVLIVDDHRSFADLLAWSLDSVPGMACVGTASSAAEGIRRVQELAPSVVVMDIQMPGTDGLAATRHIRRTSPRTAVAVVTAHRDGEWLLRAAQAGASAFIGKDGSFAEMVDMVRAAKPGSMAVAPSILRTTPRMNRTDELHEPLTERELQVLGYIAQGLQTKGISRVMGLSIHTCRGYIKSVYAKLHVCSRIEAVNRGRRLHLLAP
jgi:DNA-binding NarL/FixJ family response regulator